MPPALSVLMTVYNGQPYLASAIESILDQTYRDFELILINDGSVDDSLEVMERLAARDTRIRLVSRENRGRVASLNEGIALATAPLLALMDADDISLPERFAKQVTYLAHHPDCVAVGTVFQRMLPDGELCDVQRLPESHEEIDSQFLRPGTGFGMLQPTTMLRCAAVRAVGGYRPQFVHMTEDNDLFLRLAEVGRLANIPEVLFLYRQHASNTRFVHGAAKREEGLQAIRDACARRGLDPATVLPPSESHRPATAGGSQRPRPLEEFVWMALRGGNVRAARKYALRNVLRAPWADSAWRALYCSVRGR